MSQCEKGGFRPIPEPEALGKLTGNAASRPFDDQAALLHLREVDGELVEADAKLIDELFRQVG
jgi:hypothetical protein